MSFAAGLIDGIATGVERKKTAALRERELSIMELAAKNGANHGGGGAGPAGGYGGTYGGGAPGGGAGGSAGFDPATIDPSIRDGILEAAAELEMDPAYLATVISYETAGTFDPRKKGPRTQWGQHEGLIQFGEPQAQQYGVNWDDPIGSQLGRNGAIVRYYRANGWKPGMSMMDAYSIVNAGGPGRYGASDANNGGAPGTVADKVNHQMTGHQEKARALLGYRPAAPEAAPEPAAAPTTWRWFQSKMNGGGK